MRLASCSHCLEHTLCAAMRMHMQGVTLHALVDSCHSGTVMNLPYNAVLRSGRIMKWEEEYPGESWQRVSKLLWPINVNYKRRMGKANS
jgi:hypothetical protein